MHVFIEERQLAKGVSLSWDIAHHLCGRFNEGVVLVVGNEPIVIMAALRKQWIKVIFKLRNEYSRTLDTRRKKALALMVEEMKELVFSVHTPSNNEQINRGVYFITVGDITGLEVNCSTIYIVEGEVSYDLLSAHVRKRGVLIDYR